MSAPAKNHLQNFLFNANHQKWDSHEPIWESGDKEMLFNTQSSLFPARSKSPTFNPGNSREKNIWSCHSHGAWAGELGAFGPHSQLGFGTGELNTWQIRRPKEGGNPAWQPHLTLLQHGTADGSSNAELGPRGHKCQCLYTSFLQLTDAFPWVSSHSVDCGILQAFCLFSSRTSKVPLGP